MIAALTWLVANRNKLIQAVLGLAVAFLLSWGITLHKQNKTLSESLEMAQNNIEAYQGSLQGSQQANNVLQLTVDDLQNQNDKLVQRLDSVREKLKIKPKHLHTAATQTQVIDVNQSNKIKDSILTVKDSIYSDILKLNDLTTITYSIIKDSINIGLDVRNTQYLYMFTSRHYKNKKSFLKRLFTLDFKKVNSYKYQFINTNDLIHTDSVRVIEIKQ